MMKELESFFELKVEILLLRHSKKQKTETLINEKALLLAKYLRGEIQSWKARIATRAPP
jgi:hypothetical protein